VAQALATFPEQLVAKDADAVRVAEQTQKFLRESRRCSSAGLIADLGRRSSGWCRLPGVQFCRLFSKSYPVGFKSVNIKYGPEKQLYCQYWAREALLEACRLTILLRHGVGHIDAGSALDPALPHGVELRHRVRDGNRRKGRQDCDRQMKQHVDLLASCF
jgi:hypothetical protein